MGYFIGHLGGFFILAAAVVIAGVFTLEAGIVQDRNRVISAGKTALYTTCVGMVYYCIMAYMKNTLSGQINMFSFDEIFSFCGIDKTISIYSYPTASECFSGLGMPLFTVAVHILGKVIFRQYAGIAVWLNFLFAAAGMCCLYNMACDFFEKKVSPQMIILILALPYMFLLFTPGAFGVIFGLIAAASYALYKRRFPLYVTLGALAVLSGKLGFLAAVPFILSKTNRFPELVRSIAKNKIFSNPFTAPAFLFVISVANGVIMFLTIGGAA